MGGSVAIESLVELVAKVIDPEAFGLPSPDRQEEAGGYLSDRDEARARARVAIEIVLEAIGKPQWPTS